MRLIDADSLKQRIENNWFTAEEISADVDAEPTVDAVIVVRCKDCKYWDTSWKTRTEFHYYCPMIDGVPDGDFFCADGERRED